ncbi:MAG: disulfide bond corrector protein DsbC, partial [Verrucomicrobiota bacterium]
MRIASRRFYRSSFPRWLGATAALAVSAWAAERPVRVTAPETVPAAADGTARLRLTLEIARNYHIFGTVPSAGSNGPGPSPTTLAAGRGAPFALAGPVETSPPRKYFDPNFGADVLVLEGRAWIDVPLRASPGLN